MKIKLTYINDKIKVDSPYNAKFVDDLKAHIGYADRSWDSKEKAWQVCQNCEETLLRLLKAHYGYNPMGKNVTIKIKAKNDLGGDEYSGEYRSSASYVLNGLSLCSATGRDSGAFMCDGVSLVSGKIDSAGSRKNYYVKIFEDSIFKLTVPEEFLAEIDGDDWEIISSESEKTEKEQLLSQKEELLRQLEVVEAKLQECE